mgnify:CR=1 FL=1
MKDYTPRKFSEKKWHNSIELSKKIIQENDISNYVFIKDFKNVKNYVGSNLDIFVWNLKDVKKISSILEEMWFYLPKIDFEFDKYMYIPPNFREDTQVYAPIHIYPYLGWYTLRIDLFKIKYSQIIYNKSRNWINIFPDAYEVPLILFHWYLEDRELPNYDIYHLNYIRENKSYDISHSLEILDDRYKDSFIYLYNYYLQNSKNEEIKFKDFSKHLSVALKQTNSIFRKLYFITIHLLKWLKIIRW